MTMDVEKLTTTLGFAVEDPSTFVQALTHKSFQHESAGGRNNEKLEFLGDAVLDLVLTDLLMVTFPEDSEGGLSRKRASLVNERALSSQARALGLQEWVLLGPSEKQNALHENPRILASAFEALVGAIYQVKGFEFVSRWVKRRFQSFADSDFLQHDFAQDYKTRFQEYAQSRYKVTPDYRVASAEGPDHKRVFKVEVYVGDKVWASGEGASKKAAAQNAAEKAMAGISE